MESDGSLFNRVFAVLRSLKVIALIRSYPLQLDIFAMETKRTRQTQQVEVTKITLLVCVTLRVGFRGFCLILAWSFGKT